MSWLYVLSLHLLFDGLDFVVAQISAYELELDDRHLIEQIVVVFMAAMQHELEKLAGHAQMDSFKFA